MYFKCNFNGVVVALQTAMKCRKIFHFQLSYPKLWKRSPRICAITTVEKNKVVSKAWSFRRKFKKLTAFLRFFQSLTAFSLKDPSQSFIFRSRCETQLLLQMRSSVSAYLSVFTQCTKIAMIISCNKRVVHGRPQGGQNGHFPPWKLELRTKNF